MISLRQDGATYYVSLIEGQGGSSYWSERAGKDALSAATAYVKDPDDSKASELIRKMMKKDQHDLILVCVVHPPGIGGNADRWKVSLFEIDDIEGYSPYDFKLREFF